MADCREELKQLAKLLRLVMAQHRADEARQRRQPREEATNGAT